MTHGNQSKSCGLAVLTVFGYIWGIDAKQNLAEQLVSHDLAVHAGSGQQHIVQSLAA